MNRLQLSAFMIVFVAGFNLEIACGKEPSSTRQVSAKEPQQERAFPERQIEMYRVEGVEILNTPHDVDSTSAMTPEQLQSSSYFRLTISRFDIQRKSA